MGLSDCRLLLTTLLSMVVALTCLHVWSTFSEDKYRGMKHHQLTELYHSLQTGDFATVDIMFERRGKKWWPLEGPVSSPQQMDLEHHQTEEEIRLIHYEQEAEVSKNEEVSLRGERGGFLNPAALTLPVASSKERYILSEEGHMEAVQARFPDAQVIRTPAPCARNKIRSLGVDLWLPELEPINLRYKERGALVCRGPPCPVFSRCAGTISSCWQDDFVEEKYVSGPPLNYPQDSHEDEILENQFAGQVFLIDDAYVNDHGVVFNETHSIDHGGCRKPEGYYNKTMKVKQLDVVLNLVNWHGRNIYHLVSETLTSLLVSARVRESLPKLVVLVRGGQNFSPVEYTSLVNVSLFDLNVQEVNARYLAHAKVVIQPSTPFCGRTSRNAMKKIRLNLFKLDNAGYEDLIHRTPQQLWKSMGNKWKVVFMRRVSEPRRLVDAELLKERLIKSYGPKHVVEFWGNLTRQETLELFHDCVFLIGSHGAGLTNMLFQPPGTHVLEIRPRDYNNRAYHTFADITHLKYHLVWGSGAFRTPLVANITEILHTVLRALPPAPVVPTGLEQYL